MTELPATRLLTVEDVCALVGLGPEAVRRAVRRGDLRASRLGGRLRFRPEWIDDYVDRAGVAPTVTPGASTDVSVRALRSVPSAVPPREPRPASFRERARRGRSAA